MLPSHAFYGSLPYNPLRWPERPSDLVTSHRLDKFIPQIYERPELVAFLSKELLFHNNQEQTEARRTMRQQFMDIFHLSRIHTVSPLIPVRMAIFDVDDNIAKLYDPVNVANAWTMTRFSQKYSIPIEAMHNAVKSTVGEFGCHAPYELLHIVAEKTNYPRLSPDNPENWGIVADLRYARLALTAEALFHDTIPTIKAINEAKAKVYFSTASMPASLCERLHLWFSNGNAHLIDGVAVSKTLPGIPDVSVFATPAERRFGEQLVSSGKMMEVDLKEVKPHPKHVLVPLEHANVNRPRDSSPIIPAECFLADDSPTAMGAAREVGMHTVLNINAILTGRALELHRLWGCNRNERGLHAFIEKYQANGEHDIPINSLRELSQIFKFLPAHSSRTYKPVAPRYNRHAHDYSSRWSPAYS